MCHCWDIRRWLKPPFLVTNLQSVATINIWIAMGWAYCHSTVNRARTGLPLYQMLWSWIPGLPNRGSSEIACESGANLPTPSAPPRNASLNGNNWRGDRIKKKVWHIDSGKFKTKPILSSVWNAQHACAFTTVVKQLNLVIWETAECRPPRHDAAITQLN